MLLYQSDPTFNNSCLGGGLFISVCLQDVHFVRKKRTFFENKTGRKLSRWLILILNKIIHERLAVRNLSSRVQFDLIRSD